MYYFDLNNLKITNDTLGHSVGDQLIMNFARLLRNVVPMKNFVGRYGGDEFVVVICDTSKEEVENILNQLQEEVDQFNRYGRNETISYAYGWAFSKDYTDCTLRVLFDKADHYMYENKRTKRRLQKMSKTNKNTMDMTHGTLWNKILIFALPLAASSILQQLFNSIDTAVVGRFASSQALAAVGSNSSLIALMINLFIGISLGSNVVIAHYIGQRSEKNIQAAIHTAIVVALVSGIFVMIFGQFIAKPVLSLMGTPDDVIDLAVVYLRIYLLGMPFIMLYDFGSSILRSTGDSRRPLYSLIVAGVINTVLNLVLVIGFKMGVSGVAIATVISIWSVQALSYTY